MIRVVPPLPAGRAATTPGILAGGPKREVTPSAGRTSCGTMQAWGHEKDTRQGLK